MKTLKELFERYSMLYNKDLYRDNDIIFNREEMNRILLQAESLITNKVLDEVKREVEKQKRDNVFIPDHTPSMHGGLICRACGGQEDCSCSVRNEVIEDISTTINQLKLK